MRVQINLELLLWVCVCVYVKAVSVCLRSPVPSAVHHVTAAFQLHNGHISKSGCDDSRRIDECCHHVSLKHLQRRRRSRRNTIAHAAFVTMLAVIAAIIVQTLRPFIQKGSMWYSLSPVWAYRGVSLLRTGRGDILLCLEQAVSEEQALM